MFFTSVFTGVAGLSKQKCRQVKVITKEAVGNSWDILYAILGNEYRQNHPYEANIPEYFQQKVSLIISASFSVRVLLSADTCSRSSLRVTVHTSPELNRIFIFIFIFLNRLFADTVKVTFLANVVFMRYN